MKLFLAYIEACEGLRDRVEAHLTRFVRRASPVVQRWTTLSKWTLAAIVLVAAEVLWVGGLFVAGLPRWLSYLFAGIAAAWLSLRLPYLVACARRDDVGPSGALPWELASMLRFGRRRAADAISMVPLFVLSLSVIETGVYRALVGMIIAGPMELLAALIAIGPGTPRADRVLFRLPVAAEDAA
jgi:hypothetical protein